MDADIAIVGAGAAGLSLAWHLARGQGVESAATDVVLIEPPAGPVTSPERTWCFWGEPSGVVADVVAHRWTAAQVIDHSGSPVPLDLTRRPYSMVRSTDFAARVQHELQGRVRREQATVRSIVPAGPGSLLRGTAGGEPWSLTARQVMDSRPGPLPAARTTLLQHFRGWFVRTIDDAFDPAVATLMDFRPPQPGRGVAFGYVLPTSPREALVEYTEFSAAPLSDEGYDAALRHYTGAVLRLPAFTVERVEQGVIPMTDGVFTPQVGPRSFRIGGAGGATRPSTGYTFAAVQRQVAQVSRSLAAGGAGTPTVPFPRRHLWMDAVMLRAMATGRVQGDEFLMRLFRRQPVDRVLDFLDGSTTPAQDLAVMGAAPWWPMVRTGMELPWLRRR